MIFLIKINKMKFGFAWIIPLTYNRKAWSNRGFDRMWPIEIWQLCLDSLVSLCHFSFFRAIKYSTYKSIKRKYLLFADIWMCIFEIQMFHFSERENIKENCPILFVPYLCGLWIITRKYLIKSYKYAAKDFCKKA